MPIRCDIVSQDRVVYSGDADLVLLPGAEGEMGILPHHTPVLTVIQYGIISVKNKNQEQYFTVAGGIAEVQPDQVTILADAAETFVTWSMDGNHNFIGKAFGMFMDMDKMLGADIEKGLVQLKTVAEGKQVAIPAAAAAQDDADKAAAEK